MKGGQGLAGCGKPCLVGLMDSPVKVHTTSRPQLSQIQPKAPTGPTPHLLSTPMAAAVPTVPPSLQSDGCQTPYPSQEEMYLGTRSLGRVHVAAFIGCSGIPQSPAFLSSPFLIHPRSVFLHKSPAWQSQILPPPL